MSNPPQYVLGRDDALFFYDLIVSKSKQDIQNREDISKLSKKIGIAIEFSNNDCSSFSVPQDKIQIFKHNSAKNRAFIQHLRNAFAHLYVEITPNGRCRLLDWNPYSGGEKQSFKASLITMKGDVDYQTFKELINQFFSLPQKQNRNEQPA